MGISDEINESRDDRHLCHLSDEATITEQRPLHGHFSQV